MPENTVSEDIRDDLITQDIRYKRADASVRKEVDARLSSLEAAIAAAIIRVNVNGTKQVKARQRRLAKLNREVGVLIRTAYSEINGIIKSSARRVANVETAADVAIVTKNLPKGVGIEFEGEKLPPIVTNSIANGITIEGATMLEWTRRNSRQLQQAVLDQVRLSLEAGESTQQATTRIVGGTINGVAVPGVMATSRRNAETLVRTAIAEVVNKAALQSFQDMNDVVKAVQQISTLDSRTSDICIAYSGQVWDVNTLEPIAPSTLQFNGGPPRHFNCRSRLVPVTKSFEELGITGTEIPVATRASMDGEVPGDITFDGFLKGKSKTFQDELLGPGRARLWRSGKISLTQLVDFRGNPLTLDQLESL